MTDRAILEWLATVSRREAPEVPIVFPNEPTGAKFESAPVALEVFCSGREYYRDTEDGTVSKAIGSVVLNGDQNAGAAELDDLAERLTRAFAPSAGFSTRAETGVTGRVYSTRVERSESGLYNRRYKITIFVTLDIYEDKE